MTQQQSDLPEQQQVERWYSPAEFAAALVPPVSDETIRVWIALGYIEARNTSLTQRPRWQISQKELERVQGQWKVQQGG